MIERSVMAGGRSREYPVPAGAWVAVAVLFVMTVSTWPSGGTNPEDPPFWASSAGWGSGTLSVAAVVGLMTAAAVQDVRATRRDGTPEPIRAPRLGLALGTCAWFLGGLFCLLTFFYVQADVCGGGDTWSFGCRNRSGPFLDVLGLVLAASATPALVVLTMPANRTRLSRWLAPALILGLYLLALRMWVPHVGLGVPSREELMP
ncbi:hypothetical protein E1293_45415 [Actinomadura darangshiensis]|uniref:Tripartite tricarboxylate transporter TctB family protein n=1 Tax=Actinomadura darangshiensis TaxID=705336 RepID=A0A4R4ZPI7_9ACTN|nr:hypothetical protein [Actinomadura darangshiensis]TDD60823.1 hypothetical protein E1293_45415 [Actinomadura darangshiensis]